MKKLEIPSYTKRDKIITTIVFMGIFACAVVYLSPKHKKEVIKVKPKTEVVVIPADPLPANEYLFYDIIKKEKFTGYTDSNLIPPTDEQANIIKEIPNLSPGIFKIRGVINAFLCGKFTKKEYAVSARYFLDIEKIKPYRIVKYNNLYSIVVGPLNADRISPTRQALKGIGLGCVERAL